MALADIARFRNNEPISLRDISVRQGISLVYLEQLFLKLKTFPLWTLFNLSAEYLIAAFFCISNSSVIEKEQKGVQQFLFSDIFFKARFL